MGTWWVEAVGACETGLCWVWRSGGVGGMEVDGEVVGWEYGRGLVREVGGV